MRQETRRSRRAARLVLALLLGVSLLPYGVIADSVTTEDGGSNEAVLAEEANTEPGDGTAQESTVEDVERSRGEDVIRAKEGESELSDSENGGVL